MCLRLTALHVFFASFLLQGCQPSPYLPVDLGTASSERVLSFYFGSYTTPDGLSLEEAGIVEIDQGGTRIDVKALNTLGLSTPLQDVNGNNVIEWEELEPFLNATYYETRSFPPTLELLYTQTSAPSTDNGWMEVELDGMMISARRRILVKEAEIKGALLGYKQNNNQILYPSGTTFIAHHYTEGQRVETTISQKRADRYWDFFIYDEAGNLTPSTRTGPKELTAPTRCVGCHFGSKLFEPEVSFPASAPDGPFGARGIYVEEAARNPEITRQLDEHAKRSDTVLGLYGTIYMSRLQTKEQEGSLTEEERLVLDAIR